MLISPNRICMAFAARAQPTWKILKYFDRSIIVDYFSFILFPFFSFFSCCKIWNCCTFFLIELLFPPRNCYSSRSNCSFSRGKYFCEARWSLKILEKFEIAFCSRVVLNPHNRNSSSNKIFHLSRSNGSTFYLISSFFLSFFRRS